MTHRLVNSQRIGSRTVPVTPITDGSGCFTWTRRGKATSLADGSEQVYLSCAGSRAAKAKKGSIEGQAIKTLEFNLTTGEWIDSVDGYDHFCTPKNLNEVKGMDTCRSIETELAAGVKETAVAGVQKEYGNEAGFQKNRAAACGNVHATEKALGRAKRKKFPNVRTYGELLAEENQ